MAQSRHSHTLDGPMRASMRLTYDELSIPQWVAGRLTNIYAMSDPTLVKQAILQMTLAMRDAASLPWAAVKLVWASSMHEVEEGSLTLTDFTQRVINRLSASQIALAQPQATATSSSAKMPCKYIPERHKSSLFKQFEQFKLHVNSKKFSNEIAVASDCGNVYIGNSMGQNICIPDLAFYEHCCDMNCNLVNSMYNNKCLHYCGNSYMYVPWDDARVSCVETPHLIFTPVHIIATHDKTLNIEPLSHSVPLFANNFPPYNQILDTHIQMHSIKFSYIETFHFGAMASTHSDVLEPPWHLIIMSSCRTSWPTDFGAAPQYRHICTTHQKLLPSFQPLFPTSSTPPFIWAWGLLKSYK